MSAVATPTTPSTESLLLSLLRDQQDLSAAERFAVWHEQPLGAASAPQYRDLIPLSLPRPGEQYAFEVDLATCSGCQACVTACHSLNGLDEHETWRSVGLLQAAEHGLPVLQHVTTACHHCIEPACLAGCPTLAYEKDAVTGIVRHLDDQCFGCQYCILMCPYEVPTFSPSRGIVRKCDMCRQRLSDNEMPACVQGCPNGAISIRIVSQADMLQRAAGDDFLPRAPSPSLTTPTTTYAGRESLPSVVAGDHDQFAPAHAHWPLVFMLVLTQMSVGILAVGHALQAWLAWLPQEPSRVWINSAAALVGIVGANLALAHLGRPLQAHRAWLGWRTSWLSREVIAFGIYVPLVAASAVAAWLRPSVVPSSIVLLIEAVSILSGAVAVYCSAMIYIGTRRGCWDAASTLRRFALTSFLLGNATCTLLGAALVGQGSEATLMAYGYPLITMAIAAVVAVWRWDTTRRGVTSSLLSSDISRRGCARLLTGELKPALVAQQTASALGAFLIPLVVVLLLVLQTDSPQVAITTLCALRLALAVVGELVERYLFFASSVSTRMPGAPLR